MRILLFCCCIFIIALNCQVCWLRSAEFDLAHKTKVLPIKIYIFKTKISQALSAYKSNSFWILFLRFLLRIAQK